MTPMEIETIIDGWASLTNAIEKALRDDKSLIDEGDRWLPRLWAENIDILDLSTDNTYIVGSGTTFTMQTGGSTERVNFSIPLDILNRYL